MPLADPNASFDVAARHLFRHLQEPGRLRRNPLVRRFFEDAGGRMTRAGAKAGMALVLRLIEEGSAHVHELDVAASEDERAHRQRTIIRRTYFEQADITQIATDLGLSLRQYYRERAVISARVARYIQESRKSAVVDVTAARLDPQRFRLEQALHRFELGDGEGAAKIYEDILRAKIEAAVQIEVLCRLADIASDQGHDDVAASRLDEATELFVARTYEMALAARLAAECDILLGRARVASDAGKLGEMSEARSKACRLTELLREEGRGQVHSLYVEAHLEAVKGHLELEDIESAAAALERARIGVSASPLRLQSDFERLQASITMALPATEPAPKQAFVSLCQALQFALSCGSARRMVLATAALSRFHCLAGEKPDALDAGYRSLAMVALLPLPRFRVAVEIVIAEVLIRLGRWKQARSLLTRADESLRGGSAVAAIRLRAECDLRLSAALPTPDSGEANPNCPPGSHEFPTSRHTGPTLCRIVALPTDDGAETEPLMAVHAH